MTLFLGSKRRIGTDSSINKHGPEPGQPPFRLICRASFSTHVVPRKAGLGMLPVTTNWWKVCVYMCVCMHMHAHACTCVQACAFINQHDHVRDPRVILAHLKQSKQLLLGGHSHPAQHPCGLRMNSCFFLAQKRALHPKQQHQNLLQPVMQPQQGPQQGWSSYMLIRRSSHPVVRMQKSRHL